MSDNVPQSTREDGSYQPIKPPKLLRDNLHDDLVEALKNTGSKKAAAAKVGISPRTFQKYLQKGREARAAREDDARSAPVTPHDETYLELLDKIEAARAEIAEKHFKAIDKAEDWTSSAWILERLFPETFSTKKTVRHEGHDGGAIKFEMDTGGRPDNVKTTEDGQEVVDLDEDDYEIIDTLEGMQAEHAQDV